jgi:hypothetical protein
MTDNKTLILNQFTENCGQFIIMNNKVVRLVAIAEDEMDYYYVTYDGRKIVWHSCVGSYTVLKNKIDDKDYCELIRIAKLNHWDQDDISHLVETSTAFHLEGAIEHKKQMEKEEGDNHYLTPFCWDLN